jgi:hypothetical protein
MKPFYQSLVLPAVFIAEIPVSEAQILTTKRQGSNWICCGHANAKILD